MREIWIREGERREIAILEDGHLVEFLPEERNSSAEAIYMGRVERVVPGMKAAFVNIGQDKAGFLPLEEHAAKHLPKLNSGDRILVQVRKEAQGVKGAFLSRDVNLCGEYLLLSPMTRMIAVSSRISKEADRKRMKALGADIAQDRFGLVMRTSVLEADESLLRAEAGAEEHRPARRTPVRARAVLDPRLGLVPVGSVLRPVDVMMEAVDDRSVAERGHVAETGAAVRHEGQRVAVPF